MEYTGKVEHCTNFIMIIDNICVPNYDLLYLVYRQHVPQTPTEGETVHQPSVVVRGMPLVTAPFLLVFVNNKCNGTDKK